MNMYIFGLNQYHLEAHKVNYLVDEFFKYKCIMNLKMTI